jgi:[Skp1-protein]-hydroxyproline N-acetylglucosaminyltransferase
VVAPPLEPLTVVWDESLPTHLSDAHNDPSTLNLDSSTSPSPSPSSTIFVSIASYRDSELKHTVLDLFQQAQHPSRIFVGIVLQLYDDNDSIEEEEELYGIRQLSSSSFFSSSSAFETLSPLFQTNIRLLRINASESRGPCWARSLAQSLWQSEEYYLQIDSHMRLRAHYDSYLIRVHSLCQEIIHTEAAGTGSGGDMDSFFPVLSTYPPGYELNDPTPLTDIRPTVLVCSPSLSFTVLLWLVNSLPTGANFL